MTCDNESVVIVALLHYRVVGLDWFAYLKLLALTVLLIILLLQQSKAVAAVSKGRLVADRR